MKTISTTIILPIEDCKYPDRLEQALCNNTIKKVNKVKHRDTKREGRVLLKVDCYMDSFCLVEFETVTGWVPDVYLIPIN